MSMSTADRLRARLRDDRGSAVVEFPMVTVLILLITLAVIQAAVIIHSRNLLIDAAVQGAHHASKVGATTQDGEERAQMLIDQRFSDSFEAQARATSDGELITVTITATLPVLGIYGPAGGLEVSGRAVDEESW